MKLHTLRGRGEGDEAERVSVREARASHAEELGARKVVRVHMCVSVKE